MKMTKKIMIIDDDRTSNMVTSWYLNQINDAYEIVPVTNGKIAREVLKTAPEWPDIIFLDINMPVMNGFEFLEWLSNHPNSSKLSVYMLTSSSRDQDRERCLSFPLVQEYLEKPCTQEKLTQLMLK